jgi:hypothetical protein
MINAYGAASGAANAMSSIPYVGPILAVANAAAMLAMVGSYAANVSGRRRHGRGRSAWRVRRAAPEGEVLSAGLAERVRKMAATPREMGRDDMPTTSGSRQPTVIQVSMIDKRGAKDFSERYGGDMADSLERTGRLWQGS